MNDHFPNDGVLTLCELSGGYDSALATILSLEQPGMFVRTMFVTYGQKYTFKERQAVDYLLEHIRDEPRFAGHQDITVNLALTHKHIAVPDDYIPARNLALAGVMVNHAESFGARYIAVGNKGINRGGSEFQFPDAGQEFFGKLSELSKFIAYDPDTAPQFIQPLLGMSKGDVLLGLLQRGVDLRRLWNCYSEKGTPCRNCHHCHEMKSALLSIGFYKGTYANVW